MILLLNKMSSNEIFHDSNNLIRLITQTYGVIVIQNNHNKSKFGLQGESVHIVIKLFHRQKVTLLRGNYVHRSANAC